MAHLLVELDRGPGSPFPACLYFNSLFAIRLFGRLSLPPTSTGNLRCWSAHRIIPHHLMGVSPSAPLSRTLPTLYLAVMSRQSCRRVSSARPYNSNPGVSPHRLTCIALLATLLCLGPYLAGYSKHFVPRRHQSHSNTQYVESTSIGRFHTDYVMWNCIFRHLRPLPGLAPGPLPAPIADSRCSVARRPAPVPVGYIGQRCAFSFPQRPQ